VPSVHPAERAGRARRDATRLLELRRQLGSASVNQPSLFLNQHLIGLLIVRALQQTACNRRHATDDMQQTTCST
jgi:hypothetical protein